MMFGLTVSIFPVTVSLCANALQADENSTSQLVVEASCSTSEVLEACPIIVSVIIRNDGTSDIMSVFNLSRHF